MKKILVIIMLAAVLLVAVAGTTTAEDKIKVAYTTMTLGSPYFVEVSEGLKDTAEKLGWECTIHDPQMDVASQIAALETYISQGYEAILISAVDGSALTKLVTEAVDAGIVVATEATIVEGTTAHISPGEWDMGITLGTAVGQWCQANLSDILTCVTYGTINDPYTLVREQAM